MCPKGHNGLYTGEDKDGTYLACRSCGWTDNGLGSAPPSPPLDKPRNLAHERSVSLTVYYCQQCQYSWTKTDHRGTPERCPNCRTYTYDLPGSNGVKASSYQHHCLRCDHNWESRNEHPQRCNKCRKKTWRKSPKLVGVLT